MGNSSSSGRTGACRGSKAAVSAPSKIALLRSGTRAPLLLLLWLGRGNVQESCPSGGGAEGQCASTFPADASQSRGLQLHLVKTTVGSGVQATNGTVLSRSVLYSRPIVRIPSRLLLRSRHGTGRDPLESCVQQASPDHGSAEPDEVLELALQLLAERRQASSAMSAWMEAVRRERLVVLELTERQQTVLKGTTVEGLYSEMSRQRDRIHQAALRCGALSSRPVSQDEAAWALSVIILHSVQVKIQEQPQISRLAVIPFEELLGARWHPDAAVAIQFQQEVMALKAEEEEEVIVQRARYDMPSGEEVFMWTGRMSSSEASLRYGLRFPQNPTGIGGNVSRPPNWSGNRATPAFKEFAKFNCTSLEAFEMRFSPKGWPMRLFVRCTRIAFFMANNWYSPTYIDRVSELDKWPPPPKYKHQDWLGWTQADRELNKLILAYCRAMKRQLKETITNAVAEDFRASTDPVDQLIWNIRSEEARAFRECIALARQVSTDER